MNGIHFYINIRNYNEIIMTEEEDTGRLNHSIHALDTFFSSIMSYGKRLYSDTFIVEKITGSRLHLYVVDDIKPAFDVVKSISVFAYELSKYINHDIPKYKNLKDFIIHVGAAYGKFYDFVFTTKEGYEEETTIGYPANYAAKLQALTENSKISIDDDIYNALPRAEQDHYQKIENGSVKKYEKDCYYTTFLSNVNSLVINKADEMERVRKSVQDVDLGDIKFSNAREQLNFRDVSKLKSKKIEGIPVFADIREFTKQFDEDNSNLEEMATKTQNILETMFQTTTQNGGVHVQFQGDREMSLYHNIPASTEYGATVGPYECYKDAVFAAMRMIDNVKPYSVHIGVGEAFGTLFATRLGARDEKDNILLGTTVIEADRMEDKEADADQIAITKDVYVGLKRQAPNLANIFKQKGDAFVTTVGYSSYIQKTIFDRQHRETEKKSYNGAWGDLL